MLGGPINDSNSGMGHQANTVVITTSTLHTTECENNVFYQTISKITDDTLLSFPIFISSQNFHIHWIMQRKV